MSNYTVESSPVETSDGVKLHARLFKPTGEIKDNLVVVLVHPYSILGACQGLLKGMAAGLAEKGYRAVTFDTRGAGRSSGRASLTGFAEIKDVDAVCKWVCLDLSVDRTLLVGSSAGRMNIVHARGQQWETQTSGPSPEIFCSDTISSFIQNQLAMRRGGPTGAPIAGSAVDQIEQVVGYVSLGYPFGMTASILFGRHHNSILKSPKPKLLVMGTRDGFTSVKQLNNKLSSAAGRVETHLIEGLSHFQMEGPSYDVQMVNLILEFVASL
ncbi:hypothetical protein CJ030_MR1G022061 [Morella rubra]|uniref:Xaa-Pro dipeptidyl-peptidase-like domain-containing protein n=1 Tax=Morella rubra TaxID=262757 RepID=A0A6A1WVS6_9ROSI|nr:hypothetical protein CJ030_MR1G022061 [Morella rubra]